MLKRIESIKNIGCFIDNHSPSFQFENLTFIYGDNSYGKTTVYALRGVDLDIKEGDMISINIKKKETKCQ